MVSGQTSSLSCSKPAWLKKNINLSLNHKLKTRLRNLSLNTVCEESRCPNISECFSKQVATFLILGDVCTRGCSFCLIGKGKPGQLDFNEPQRIAQAAKLLNLNYLVITSPTRDDLLDGGAAIFVETVREILALDPKKRVELLIPDFLGKKDSIEKVVESGAETIAHNLETVPKLYKKVRKGASYRRSLFVLETTKKLNQRIFTKTGLMFGLGEKEKEVKRVLADLNSIGCDFLTLGQYLPPSRNNYPLKSYVHPDTFDYFKNYALKLGFKNVISGPYVRSSYMAHLMSSGL
ncbi:MAG: lipoyl synthase [Candidatus Omnitrophica bacterium]|nr:lipoyl synthase [Candidatus Omnitrophota bacterium]